MTDIFTSFEDFKAWKSTEGYNTIGNFISIKNKGMVNGDCKLIAEKNKMPLVNNEYVAMKVTNGIGDEFTVTLAHPSISGNATDWLEELLGTFGIVYVGYSYNATLGFKWTYKRPVDTSYQTNILMYVRKKVNGTSSIVQTIDTYTSDWAYSEYEMPENIIPVGDGWTLEMYCHRFFSYAYPNTPSIGNYGRDLRFVLDSYNITSYFRTNNMLPLYVEGYSEPVTESETTGSSYFYDCYTYSDNFAQTNKTLVNHKWGNIKVPSGCRVWGVVDGNLPYNIKLHVTSGYEFMGAIQNDGTYVSMDSIDVRITARKTVNDGNGVYYYGALSTNIPIFDNEEDGNNYGTTGDDSTSIYDDVWNGSTTHRFGELITKTQTASYNLPSHGRPYYNVNTHIAELIGWISSERVQSIFADFTLWGNNPIDMVCDFYWTPLDLLTLGYTHSGPHFIQFGYIYAEDLTSSASEPYTKLTCNNAFHSLMGTEYTLVNEVISGVYNDWRDYELFKFKLYLPFMGTIDLPPHLIINKTLKVTIKYFISTHTLHYYVYVDNVVAYEYDVIVGCDVPLTGADVVGKARQNLSAYGADYGHFASMGASAVRGDFVGAVSSGIGLMTNKIMRDSATSLSTWGTQSVTGNICDYGSCYMVIEEQQHYAPPKLHDMYNYPSYYIGTIGSCSGYCEIENVKLTGMGSFSESEKNKVKELLRNGVIL